MMTVKKTYLAAFLLPLAALGVYVKRKANPKNVRNNNPLNIKRSAKWED